MKVLLDTQVVLWMLADTARLTPVARSTLEQPANSLHVSIASLWEISIKVGLNKLTLHLPLRQLVDRELPERDIAILPISPVHAVSAGLLPLHHRDPFDRMLAAQSLASGFPIVSADPIFDRYQASRLW